MTLVPVVLLALLAAGAVLLLARASSEDAAAGDESPWESFRRGLRARREPDAEQAQAAAAAAVEPRDVSLADFLRANVQEGDGYLHVEELTEDLHRAAQTLRVRRGA
ncbi:hypothetical protein [Cellulomonas shaoxiangyii]|uniref:Uncharacterized protein n=1 Tax=Cellulomonas shaoxiangyii TaxID=2566013 RepID=A0A4P7SJJ0_9CELL|nr:hypothetical protein [Cellulomonas shaoxiangyii]QCB93991.1 hypothetical protein E5225_10855 [Cellulomonas shaoxiangyii]TGY83024.1 hypothetical protein E5226_12595 [Cellulomonas shaoxiangyii]